MIVKNMYLLVMHNLFGYKIYNKWNVPGYASIFLFCLYISLVIHRLIFLADIWSQYQTHIKSVL